MDSPKNSKRGPKRALLGILTALALTGLLVAALGIAFAKPSKTGIRKIARSDRGATALARSILQGNSNKKLVTAKFVTVPPGNDPVAVSRTRLAGFPLKGKAFAILSTGCARLADNRNRSSSTGCRDAGVVTRGARDVTIWRIRLQVPKGANCLSFRFKFLSEEFPEYVGSRYNDGFIAEVGRAPRWKAGTFPNPAIRAPGDFATTRNGKSIISINGTGVARVSRAAARGTTYDAATGKLRASTPVKPGARNLYLSIFDQGDRQYDSAVFIDRLLVRHANRCVSGLVRSN